MRWGALGVVAALATACLDPLPLAGSACPCADGFQCCPNTNTCEIDCGSDRDAGRRDTGVRDAGRDGGERDAGRDGGDRDAGRDAGPRGVDAGFLDGGALPDAGMPPDSIGPWTWSNIRGTTDRSANFTTTWTGQEVLMVGGRQLGLCTIYHDRYNPWTDTWRRFSIDFVSRGAHAALWTGDRYLAWGGDVCALSDDTFANGALWDPFGHTTTPIPDAPGAASFPVALWLGDALFVHGGECNATSCLERGAIYDPATEQWRSVAAEGGPAPFQGRRTAQWNGNEVMIWGGTVESSGRYFPAVDAWQSFPEPSFTLGAGPSVWTGTELIVWDGTTGGRFDPRTATWVETARVGAPVGVTNPQAVWTGVEMILLGEDGGAHYDPAADRWRPVTENNAYYANPNAKIVWTGRDVVVIGSTVSGTHGARYGPRLSGDAACDGGGPPLAVQIRRPTARAIADGVIPLQAVIDTSVSVQRVSWFLDDVLVANSESATLDLGSATFGPHTLKFEVQGTTSTVCDSRTIFVDEAPQLDVTMPVDDEVATPNLLVAATCTDNGPEGCALRVTVPIDPQGSFLGEDVVLASSPGAGVLMAPADLSAYEGREITLVIEATDAFGMRTAVERRVFVESNPALLPHATVEDELCDVTLGRVLTADPTGFTFAPVGAGASLVVPTAQPPNCATSRIVPPQDAVLQAGSQITDVGDDAVRGTFASGGIRVAGDWIVSVNGFSLERRRPRAGLVDVVGDEPYPGEGYDIAPNGDVFHVARDGTIAITPGGTTTPTTLGALPPPGPLVGMVASDAWGLWRRRTSTTTWTLELSDGTTTQTLTGPAEYGAAGPRRDRDYRVAGAWVAFEGPDALAITQVWLRRPDGTVLNASDTASDASLAGLAADGGVMFAHQDRLTLFDPATETRSDVGSTNAQVVRSDGTWFLRYGRQIFRLNP
ncbi:MAG: hypothetical protein RIT81_43860 [Deltaproteobacteria bacterium]